MHPALLSLLDEPAVAHPPRRVWRDWVLVGGGSTMAVIEATLRPALTWRWPTLLVTLLVLPTLLWRRTSPLAMMIAGFGTMSVLTVVQMVVNPAEPLGLHTAALLVLPLYSLVRWGSGRHVAIGAVVATATATLAIAADYTGLSDAIGGFAVLGIVMAIGAAVRFRGRARQRELEQVRLLERGQLARDLHDTVAHHVSAIAIRAQAGLAVAATRPDAPLEALRVIEAEATRTLAEMRLMVGVLRFGPGHEPADFAPTPTLEGLRVLESNEAGSPKVIVSIGIDLTDVAPAVATAVFRIAREAVTNARRHARHASRITVTVTRDGNEVRLRVADDGDPVGGHTHIAGYGLLGMSERAELFDGHLAAGPGVGRGWVVDAALPLDGVRT